jgi:hypothetical protein
MDFVGRVRHWNVNDVGGTFGGFQDVFPTRVWDANHGEQNRILVQIDLLVNPLFIEDTCYLYAPRRLSE